MSQSRDSDGLTASQLAAMALPGLTTAARNIRLRAARENWPYAERRSSGGLERVYPITALPAEAQAAYVRRLASTPVDVDTAASDELLERFETASEANQRRARERLPIVAAVVEATHLGLPVTQAIEAARAGTPFGFRTVRRWYDTVAKEPRAHWLPLLLPAYEGTPQPRVEIHPTVRAIYAGLYLRAERPSHAEVYRNTAAIAEQQGLPMPSPHVMRRRILQELGTSAQVLAREGTDALMRLVPSMVREKGHLHAMQILNGDGHVFDARVRWPDGHVSRPMLMALQDVYSGMIVGWRIDETENGHAIRLLCADVFTRLGIPSEIYFDNGRAWMNKEMTGGLMYRNRFPYVPGEAEGFLVELGVKVHCTTPYHGQAKPIERAWRDVAGNIAKDIRLAGFYTGSNPTAKPHNYDDEKAVDLDLFLEVVADGVREHNERPGRETATARGRSFHETFMESYERSPITKAGEVARRHLLLSVRDLSVHRSVAQLQFMGNVYTCPELLDHLGKRVRIRFDPQDLHKGLYVYTDANKLIGFAETQLRAGFNDLEAPKAIARIRKQVRTAAKAKLEAELRLDAAELAAFQQAARAAKPEPMEPVASVVRPLEMKQAQQRKAALRGAAPELADDPSNVAKRAEAMLLDLGRKALADLDAAHGKRAGTG